MSVYIGYIDYQKRNEQKTRTPKTNQTLFKQELGSKDDIGDTQST